MHWLFENVEKWYYEAQINALRGRDAEALRSLTRAAEMGYNDADQLEHDLAFAKLRKRPEFVAISQTARRHAL